MLMSHSCAQQQLREDQSRSPKRKLPHRLETSRELYRLPHFDPPPGREQCNRANEREVHLRQCGMKDSDFILHPDHAQTTQNPLKDDRDERAHTEPTKPASFLLQCQPEDEDDSQESDSRGKETV